MRKAKRIFFCESPIVLGGFMQNKHQMHTSIHTSSTQVLTECHNMAAMRQTYWVYKCPAQRDFCHVNSIGGAIWNYQSSQFDYLEILWGVHSYS